MQIFQFSPLHRTQLGKSTANPDSRPTGTVNYEVTNPLEQPGFTEQGFCASGRVASTAAVGKGQGCDLAVPGLPQQDYSSWL